MAKVPDLASDIRSTILKQKGVIFARSAIVHREMYSGQDILASNSAFTPDKTDKRGYLPVEWWIMSRVRAENNVPREDEGVTALLCEEEILITKAVEVAEKDLFGAYSHTWPLTKVLDIGGEKVSPEFEGGKAEDETEIPPIPSHVHAGCVKDGKCQGQGKDEAYFFPPLDVKPYNKVMPATKTRIGIKPGVAPGAVVASLAEFGLTDRMYGLLQAHEVLPWHSWMVPSKLVHAPGPWLTFEIQRPQDDFNLLSWRMGVKVESDKLLWHKQNLQLRGLKDEKDLFEQTIDWKLNVDPNLRKNLSQKCEVLAEGGWGKKLRIFYQLFYGEALVIRPGQEVGLEKTDKPRAGVCWSGSGRVNNLELSCTSWTQREFLLTPNADLKIENSSPDSELILFLVYPIVG